LLVSSSEWRTLGKKTYELEIAGKALAGWE